MFSAAYTYLKQALQQASAKTENFYALRDLLYAAKNEVTSDADQPVELRKMAENAIDRAITYTYMRTNPAPMTPAQFMSMASTPISPFERKPAIFSYSQVPTTTAFPQQWTTQSRETLAIKDCIREAINLVVRGLH